MTPAAERRLAPATERLLVAGLAALSALGALFVQSHPSGWIVSDAVLRAGLAAAVVWFASAARRWTWFVLAGAAGALSTAIVPLVAAVTALGLAYASVFAPRRVRLAGALVGLVSVQILLRLPSRLPAAVTALVVAAAVCPCLWSGYKLHGRAARRHIRIVLEVAFGVCVLVLLAFGLAAASARNTIDQGVAQAQAALDAARVGHQDEAVRRFERAVRTFERGQSRMDAWWARPARALPGVGVQADTMSTVLGSGTDLTAEALRTAEVADYQKLRADNGQIDLALVRAYQEPVRRLTATVEATQRDLAKADTPWLIPPLRDQVDDFQGSLGRAHKEAVLASDVLEVAPRLLGADGPRRYAILFGTPAETRELGGYVGNIGELTAVDGKLTLDRTNRATDFTPATRDELNARSLPTEAALPTRYRSYELTRFLGNISGTEDFPTVAETFGLIYPQVGRPPVDGVIYVDPYGLGGLLQLTGPVQVKGVPQPLTAQNAANFLLKTQYTIFDNNGTRVDFLDDASRATFDALTNRTLPGPRTVADALSPFVRQRRILAYSFKPEDQALFDRIGLSGRVPASDGADYLSVTTANANPNKIDAYLQRDLSDRVQFDPRTGGVSSTVTVHLTNTAPGTGLPDYTISNQEGLPPGTNRTFLALYTPLRLTQARLDGKEVEPEPQREYDRSRYSFFVEVPPGGAVNLEVDLQGQVHPAPAYSLTYLDQPVVNPGRWAVQVFAPPGVKAGAPTLDGPVAPPEVSAGEGLARVATTIAGGVVELRVPFNTGR